MNNMNLVILPKINDKWVSIKLGMIDIEEIVIKRKLVKILPVVIIERTSGETTTTTTTTTIIIIIIINKRFRDMRGKKETNERSY